MPYRYPPYDFPDVILLLGTDASGKDYVANVIEKMIREAGGDVEKRKRYFSGRVTHETSSLHKSFLDVAQEFLFLAFYPYLGKLLPLAMNLLIRFDLARFRPADKKLIVVGHSAVRALAFYWGRENASASVFDIPDYLCSTLRLVREKTGVHAIILDVEHDVRQARINRRLRHGVSDRFDRYMLEDPVRSERIEECLIRAAQQLLGAVVMANNDLHETEIRKLVLEDIRTRTERT